jgi:hypothetical protein
MKRIRVVRIKFKNQAPRPIINRSDPSVVNRNPMSALTTMVMINGKGPSESVIKSGKLQHVPTRSKLCRTQKNSAEIFFFILLGANNKLFQRKIF